MTREKPRCGAQKRGKPGQTCQSTFLFPNGRCKLHGGNAASGAMAPAFKHGRHSKHFPAIWGDLTERLADPDLRSIAVDLVVLDQRMGDILARAATLKGDAAKARAFEEYQGLAETRSRLIDAEARRLERGHSAVPVTQAQGLIRAIALAVRKEIEAVDGQVLDGRAFMTRLSIQLDRLTGRSRLRTIQAEAVGPPAGADGKAAS